MGGVTKPPDMPTRVPGTVVALWGSMKHPPMATTDEQIKSLPDNATPRQIRFLLSEQPLDPALERPGAQPFVYVLDEAFQSIGKLC